MYAAHFYHYSISICLDAVFNCQNWDSKMQIQMCFWYNTHKTIFLPGSISWCLKRCFTFGGWREIAHTYFLVWYYYYQIIWEFSRLNTGGAVHFPAWPPLQLDVLQKTEQSLRFYEGEGAVFLLFWPTLDLAVLASVYQFSCSGN